MIVLKILKTKDVNQEYLKWMNDFKIHEFTEQKNKIHSINSIKKFVKDKIKTKNEFLYGIFLKNKKHIGNIKLGPINNFHKTAEISYFIGDKNYWNKGCSTKAINQIVKIAKKKGIKKLQAGFYQMNHGSKRVLEKNNFKLEGVFKSQIIFKKKRYKKYVYGLVL